MGQHKHNPTVALAKEGKLEPLPVKMGKRETERVVREAVTKAVLKTIFKQGG